MLTNNHVVEGADQIQVKLGDSDTTYDGEVVGTDPATDLALLEVDAPADQLHPLTLGDSSEMEVGDPVVAIGNPFGLDRTVTSGIVSALQRQIEAPDGFSITNVIQTDAAINPGNSGGPLINADGEVIGINSQIETGGGGSGNVGIGFAIPIDTVRAEIHQLETDGEVEHAFLGISGGTITPDLAKAINLPVEEGVIVQTVVKGGPADKAGIEGGNTSATIEGAEVSLGGDIITEVDGKKVDGDGRNRRSHQRSRAGRRARADDPARRLDQDGDRDARRAARARSKEGRAPNSRALAACDRLRVVWGDAGQVLRDHQSRRRGGGCAARRLGHRADPLRPQPEVVSSRAIAAEIGAAFRRKCEVVGVFVNPTLEEVAKAVENAA